MRRLAWLALILVACSTGQTASEASPKPTQATPSAWSCRLPIVVWSTDPAGGPPTHGFLRLPINIFTSAPGTGKGLFYNRSLGRWVEWAPESFSDDGSRYAYAEGDNKSGRVHLVDVATMKDTVLADGGPWRVVGLQPEAVYAMRIEFLPESPAFGVMQLSRGLWKIPLGGGGPVQLTSDSRIWPYVSKGAAWGHSFSLNIAGGPNDVVLLDLKTREQTVWFDVGKRSHVLAIDGTGTPLIMSEAGTQELWRVPAPGAAVKIWSGSANEMSPSTPVAVDGDVIWFSSPDMGSTGIYRYSAPRGLELVGSLDRPAWVAGPCA